MPCWLWPIRQPRKFNRRRWLTLSILPIVQATNCSPKKKHCGNYSVDDRFVGQFIISTAMVKNRRFCVHIRAFVTENRLFRMFASFPGSPRVGGENSTFSRFSTWIVKFSPKYGQEEIMQSERWAAPTGGRLDVARRHRTPVVPRLCLNSIKTTKKVSQNKTYKRKLMSSDRRLWYSSR